MKHAYFRLCGIVAFWDGVIYTEPFVVGFSTLAFYLVLGYRMHSPSHRQGRCCWPAFRWAAQAFKQTGIFLAFVLLLILARSRRQAGGTFGEILLSVGWVAIGMIAATLLFLLPLLVAGTSALRLLRFHLALAPSAGNCRGLDEADLYVRSHVGATKMAMFYPLVLLFFLLRERLSARIPYEGLAIWLVVAFLAVNASGRVWGHEVQQILPILALCAVFP